MKITITNKISIEGIPVDLQEELAGSLVFTNPKWIENNKMGRWQGETPKFLKSIERDSDTGATIIPRGYIRQLIKKANSHGIDYTVIDNRRMLPQVAFYFKGQLREFQEKAVRAMLEREFGVLNAPTGSGKTVIALYLIVRRGQPVLIVVHTRELLYQWIDRIGQFLGIPPEDIGIIGDGKKTIGEKITVALVQSLYKRVSEVAPYVGYLIVDECHRTPSRTFTEAVSAFDCKYTMGLSATPYRRDGLSRLIYWHLGDVAHEVDKDALVETGDLVSCEVVLRETNFRPWHDPSEEYTRMLSELTEDRERNALIAGDIAREAKNGGGVCLVLSDRKAHCRELLRILKRRFEIQGDLLIGDLKKKDREDVVSRLNEGRVKVLVATGQLIGEGFDCRELSTLFLSTPIKFTGRVTQYLGRVLRPAPGKEKATVFDYVDVNVGVLVAAAKSRGRVLNYDVSF